MKKTKKQLQDFADKSMQAYDNEEFLSTLKDKVQKEKPNKKSVFGKLRIIFACASFAVIFVVVALMIYQPPFSHTKGQDPSDIPEEGGGDIEYPSEPGPDPVYGNDTQPSLDTFYYNIEVTTLETINKEFSGIEFYKHPDIDEIKIYKAFDKLNGEALFYEIDYTITTKPNPDDDYDYGFILGKIYIPIAQNFSAVKKFFADKYSENTIPDEDKIISDLEYNSEIFGYNSKYDFTSNFLEGSRTYTYYTKGLFCDSSPKILFEFNCVFRYDEFDMQNFMSYFIKTKTVDVL